MTEEEATIDGNEDTGEKATDTAEDIIGDTNSVLFYGIWCLAWGISAGVARFVFDGKYWWDAHAFYLPAGIMWLSLSYFDSEFLRKIYRTTVSISLLSPFLWEVAAIGYELAHLSITVRFIIDVLLYAAGTIGEVIFVLALIPEVYDWIDDAPIKDNGESKVEDEEEEDVDEDFEADL